MGMSNSDSDCRREHWFDISARCFRVFARRGFLEIEQKLNLDDGQTAPSLGLSGLPERGIGRWPYTIVPWED
jgi:hypothetical protein